MNWILELILHQEKPKSTIYDVCAVCLKVLSSKKIGKKNFKACVSLILSVHSEYVLIHNIFLHSLPLWI